ncbi:MAG: YlxR family protein [Myxococcales bacterium]|nr:YlxR family protein [Myxococcales bacterium]
MSTPIRTCVGCRQRREQASLLRMRRLGHGVVVPAERRGTGGGAHGRSAYLCPERACLERAIKRGGLSRAFAREGRVSVDGPTLWAALHESIRRRTRHYERSAVAPDLVSGYCQLLAIETAMLASGREA